MDAENTICGGTIMDSTIKNARSHDATRTRDKTIAVLTELLGPPETWKLAARLWDGTRLGPAAARTTAVLPHLSDVLRRP